MHIGMIGGIGPAATDFYYRKLIGAASALKKDLELTIVHADTSTLLANLIGNNEAAQCAIYAKLTDRLAAAGAQNVVVTSIAGHFCIDRFEEISALPVIDLTSVLSSWLQEMGARTVGILGTETVMSSGMYGKLAPVDVLAPKDNSLQNVHEAYITLARSGQPTDALRKVFLEAGKALISDGAEAVLLGGTDLNAIMDAETSPFPIVDCASIHIEEIARFI
ncbi:aspartate/glutamate racemase family protein [uncultured Roseibium sp.]|uniref:aspartate/glutamate racemase family protein n=1 Tax=uncultured Roseibium sp. TaxID=1936171 RepID=UPI0026071609|nr:aspartate/glutamate racemase family protein [uncultured Roseibium sp.]